MKPAVFAGAFAVLLSATAVFAANTCRPACDIPAPDMKTIRSDAFPGPSKGAIINSLPGNTIEHDRRIGGQEGSDLFSTSSSHVYRVSITRKEA